jgi:hypothetical protein
MTIYFLIVERIYEVASTGADLRYAKVTDQQLAEAKSLEGATMPDGSKHP